MECEGTVSRKGWVLFAVMCLVWGIPYLFIKVAVGQVSVPVVVFARTAIGALILLPLAIRSARQGGQARQGGGEFDVLPSALAAARRLRRAGDHHSLGPAFSRPNGSCPARLLAC